MDIALVIQRAKCRFRLDGLGIHGFAHWQRVYENGMHVAKQSGADPEVVHLFAFLHDCCRENDSQDPDHGPRAAVFAGELRQEGVIVMAADRFDLLTEAIHGHTSRTHHADATIGTCWDADRLDIGRVGFVVDTGFLNTAAAKDVETRRWALERSLNR